MGVAHRLGVFGGTFDPVHNGHLTVAEAAGDSLALDEVLFVPAGQPRLKEREVSAAAHHRLRMVQLATELTPHFTCSDIETKRRGPTYTADTLERLGEERGECAVFLIVGLDALVKFHRWGRPDDILGMATIVGVPRPGHERLDRTAFEWVAPGSADRAVTLVGPMTAISSTEIRERVRRGLCIEHLVPETVGRYIRDNRLYAEMETRE